MQPAQALQYVALHIHSNGGNKYIKKLEDGLYGISNKRDRNSLASLLEEVPYDDNVSRVALASITSYFRTHYRKHSLNPMLMDRYLQLSLMPPKTHMEALLYFMGNFRVHLNRRARPINHDDSKLLRIISGVYWDYANGHQETYNRWLTEFFVGTHKVIRDDKGEIHELLRKKTRKSSHYRIGEKQHHISGSLIPEALFHKGEFAYDPKSKTVIGGRYWKDLSAEEKNGKERIQAFWIQTENTPDGPHLFDYLYHRTVDFVRYLFYKHILRSDRPQIGPYKKANGDRGLPDHTPLFIQPLKPITTEITEDHCGSVVKTQSKSPYGASTN